MSAQSIRSLASSAPKSILKRPAPLPLSPRLPASPRSPSFNLTVSAGALSPHVHFPTSANMVNMFSTHSPSTYDRAAIVVSPNPLALPAWGDRVYSPTTGAFKKVGEDPRSPLITVSFSDPAIPTPPKAATQPSNSRAAARFRTNVASPMSKALPRDDLGSSMMKYPRSPYPSAPMSPVSNLESNAPRQRTQSASAPLTPRERRVMFAADTPSRNDLLSPVAENPRSGRVADQESSLSNAFWESVTLSENAMAEVQDDMLSPNVTTFTFGTRDGGLWSPGLPRKTPQVSNPLSMLSPRSRTTSKPVKDMGVVLSPTPNDPFSAFPSFSAVLTMGGADSVTYPPPVIMQVEGTRNTLRADID